MPKGTEAQRTAFKCSLDKSYRKSVELGWTMTKAEMEAEIKDIAGFKWASTKHEDVTTMDLMNLIIYADLYSEKVDLYNCYPNEEIHDNDDFNPSRTDKN